MSTPQKRKGRRSVACAPHTFLSCYTHVLVCNTCMHAEDSDFLPGAKISIR